MGESFADGQATIQEPPRMVNAVLEEGGGKPASRRDEKKRGRR